MGIRPWIERSRLSSVTKENDSPSQESLKLLIFTASTLSIKAQSLFRQMMAYIGLNDQEQSVIALQEHDSLNIYTSRIEQQNPLAILVFGLNEQQLTRDWEFSGAFLHSFDPDYLLLNPAVKKVVFNDLTHIRQLVSLD